MTTLASLFALLVLFVSLTLCSKRNILFNLSEDKKIPTNELSLSNKKIKKTQK